MSETTYTSLRANLASVLDRVSSDQEIIVVRRRGTADVALVPARELAGLIETAHLLRSPRNARRLLSALKDVKKGRSKKMSLEALRRDAGLSSEL